MATATSDQVAPLRRHLTRSLHGPSFLASHVVRLVCAGLLIWVAAIHIHLWFEGYRDIRNVGPLFLADAVVGFVLAAVLLVWPRPLAGLLGAGFMIATLGGLIVSFNFALFGFRESSGASFVSESIILESAGAVALLAWAVVVWRDPTRSRFGGTEAARGSMASETPTSFDSELTFSPATSRSQTTRRKLPRIALGHGLPPGSSRPNSY